MAVQQQAPAPVCASGEDLARRLSASWRGRRLVCHPCHAGTRGHPPQLMGRVTVADFFVYPPVHWSMQKTLVRELQAARRTPPGMARPDIARQ